MAQVVLQMGVSLDGYVATFVQGLSRLELVDEYRLVILPVALGNGMPLFKDLVKPPRLDLEKAESFPDGTVIKRVPAGPSRWKVT